MQVPGPGADNLPEMHPAETHLTGGPPELGDVVERFDHLALAVSDVQSTLPLVELLGGVYRNGGHHIRGGFRWLQFTMPGDTKLELISPLDPADTDNFIVRFLGSRGEGPHHVTLKVRDLGDAIAAAERLGFEVVARDESDPTWREAFVHPRSAHGMLVQLAEFDDGSEPAGLSLAAATADPVASDTAGRTP
jgi:methylmalonyl-CoA/ethylmalonyl-CoA epimerase